MIESSGHSDPNCCDCMVKSPLFKALTDEQIALVHQNKTTIVFRKGEIIRKQGTFLTHVVSLNSGIVKVYLEGPGDHNTIIRIVKPVNFIGGPGIYYDQVHHYSISALTEASVCFIDLQLFRNLIDINKDFAYLFLHDFSKNILNVYNRLVLLTQKQMSGRIADTLLYLFNDIFESHKFIPVLTRQDIADLAGMSKDSAIKVLRIFQKEGIINYTDHELELLDESALKRISRTG